MIKRFSRFELKYIITAKLRDRLLAEVQGRMAPDVQSAASGTYAVTSLYFDTPDLAFYRAKIDGLRFRRKLRIRLYGDPGPVPDPTVMVEIKQRIARTTQKRRLAAPLSLAHALCTGRAELAAADTSDGAVAGEVDFLARSLGLGPVCVVAYQRRAFVGGEFELGLRVTFDEALHCTPPTAGLLGGAPRYRPLSPELVVLEVKANDRIPDWVAGMLARHSCPLRRFSKYCSAVAALHERGSEMLAS